MTTPRHDSAAAGGGGGGAGAGGVSGTSGAHQPDFTVSVVACGLLGDRSGVVYAVAVSQPVQSWTVVRSHEDFEAVADVLSQTVPTGIPRKCPPVKDGLLASSCAACGGGGVDGGAGATDGPAGAASNLIVEARNEVQDWLSTILTYPAARETDAFRNFLTMGANTILPQYEGVTWTQFAAAMPTSAPTGHTAPSSVGTMMFPVALPTQQQHPPGFHHHQLQHQHSNPNQVCTSVVSASGAGSPSVRSGPVDDMEMDDMFMLDGDGGHDDDHDDDDDDDDDNNNSREVDEFNEDVIPPAAERYKPTDEAVTDEDEFDIAGDVEMIEDIGSLAQSMGASHLGRSLNLQAEMKTYQQIHSSNKKQLQQQQQQSKLQGLNIGGAASGISAPTSPRLASPSSVLTTSASDAKPAPPPATAVGGIGGAMMAAAAAAASVSSSASSTGNSQSHHITNTSFNRRPPESSPRLDSFKMIRVIGKGSFGKVFLVREVKTARIYALKVLRKDNIIKRNQVEHTKTERSVLGYVKHPFIVGMNMAFQSRDKLYFVLDYCAGGELFFHLGKQGRFPAVRSRFYAAEIILAISYVHSLDIIYRDLKPENVLLDAEGHIRLTDFGLSKEGISSSSSGAYSFCGTPEYLAPEILNRQGHGRAVDWWSLGALLYEMLTGLPPFYCQDRERLFEKIRKSELSYPPTVTPPAVSLLKGLLTKDPNRRLGSGPGDAEDIKVKEFFASIEWDKLRNGEVKPPWRPEINGVLDTSQFDKEFTNMPVSSPHSMQRVHGFGATPVDSHFDGFTFTDRLLHGPGPQP